MASGRSAELSEELVVRLVDVFYARVRKDAVLGPIFERRLEGRWDRHLTTMTDFWSSVALTSGRYSGKPHVAHQPLGLTPEHFGRWLRLFETTVIDLCEGPSAAFFIDRAHRIADSLQIGLNIGPKALHLPLHGHAERGVTSPTSTEGELMTHVTNHVPG